MIFNSNFFNQHNWIYRVYNLAVSVFKEQIYLSTPLSKSLSFNTELVKTKNFATVLTKSITFKTDL